MILAQREKQTVVPTSKLLGLLSIVFTAVILLTIAQDFLESIRNSSSFYIEESLLFKAIWLLFVPILALLHRSLQKVKSKRLAPLISFTLSASVFHLFAVSVTIWGFSMLFFGGRYDLYKVFSYTLAQDLYKIVMVYACFNLVHFHFLAKPIYTEQIEKQCLAQLTIPYGRNKVMVLVNEIIKITSATPYIAIHVGDRAYLHADTLKSFHQKIDSEVFVQIHKTTIVNLQMIAAVKSRLNGDYDLQLKNGELVRLSRTYAEEFKKKLNLGPQDNL